MGENPDNFKSLIFSARVYRTYPILMVMFVSASFANKININFLLMCICCVLIYSAAGIHNAKKDNDYFLPNYTYFIIISLILCALIISLNNIIIFLTSISAIFLGIIYNTLSRYILFGDATILSITHFALPSLSSSLILKLETKLTLMLAVFLMIIGWFIIHSKNLKDTENDKKRKYATITTKLKFGSDLAIIFIIVSSAFMTLGLLFFDFSFAYLIVHTSVLILVAYSIWNMSTNKEEEGIKVMRLVMSTFIFGIILDKTSDFYIFIISCVIYICSISHYLSHIKIKESFKTNIGVNKL